MSHVAYISRRLSKIIVEAPRNSKWAAAINHIIPSTDRKSRDGIWYFDEKWYFAIRALTEFYHGHYSDLVTFDKSIVVTPTHEWYQKWKNHLESTTTFQRETTTGNSKYNFQELRFEEIRSPHAVLYLKTNAPREVVIAAYRALSKTHHPDVGGDPAIFKNIQKAYEELING